MKRSLLALAFLLIATPVFAVCPASLQLKDNAGATPTAKYTDDGSGNCMANIAVQDGADATQGAKADAVASTDTGTFSLTALIKRLNQSITSLIAAVQAAIPSGTNRIGYVSDDPCTQLTKTPFTFSTTSGTVQIVAPSGVTQVYICSLSIIGDTPGVKVNLVGGTGAACTTGTPVAALGSTTAANGMSLAANGGLTFGNGGATVSRTTTAGHGMCVIQSATTLLAGGGTFVQQ